MNISNKFAFWIAVLVLISGVAAIAQKLGDEGRMPDLDGASVWFNSTPLGSKSLRGKVVLVNFWTYGLRCNHNEEAPT